jgi:peroxiredoxin
MISRGSSEENRRLVQNEGLTFPILAWEDDVVKAYQVPGTPFFYAIDGRGVIASRGPANSLPQLEDLVKAGL